MKLEANKNLLIPQWQAAPKMSGMVEGMINIAQKDIMDVLSYISDMWDIDKAQGDWLDFIGSKVGIDRPNLLTTDAKKRFGFENVDRADSFDQVPYKGELSDLIRYPISDTLFRKMIKARAVTVTSRGSFDSFKRAVSKLDKQAKCEDNMDMTITIYTDHKDFIELADKFGAIPRPAGVSLSFTELTNFGFDNAGQGFDRVVYR